MKEIEDTKILIGMPSADSWGGPIASEPPFVEALKKIGYDVTEEVYVYGEKDKPTPFFERIKRVFSVTFSFRKLLKTNAYDLIHLNTAFDLKTVLRDSFALFLMKPKKAKIFLKIHGARAEDFENANFLKRALLNYLERKVDAFGIFTTEELANFQRIEFDKSKFYFIKNAISDQENLSKGSVRRQKERDEVFELLFISRFVETKGLIETIRACLVLKEKGYKFVLHCIGDGEIKSEAEREVEKLNLTDFVRFTGYIPETEVTKYLVEKDILIFPTRHSEGFPIVIFKAVVAGVPIITTKIRAAADYLREPENCLFCNQSPENIADKVVELIENRDVREKMTENNIIFGKTLSPEAVAEEYSTIYRKILRK